MRSPAPLHDEFYDMDISGLSTYIAELCPDTPAAEVRRRATLQQPPDSTRIDFIHWFDAGSARLLNE
jgi:hypothetical protein